MCMTCVCVCEMGEQSSHLATKFLNKQIIFFDHMQRKVKWVKGRGGGKV